MITYQVEKYEDCILEIDPIFPAHYQELAVDKDVIPLDKDEAWYKRLADEGILHIVTVRKDGKLIGYHFTLVKTHLHYASTLMGFVDLYYILPEERKGWVFKGLFREAERTLKARGVVRIVCATKKHLDKSKLFEYLGYNEHEILFAKLL